MVGIPVNGHSAFIEIKCIAISEGLLESEVVTQHFTISNEVKKTWQAPHQDDILISGGDFGGAARPVHFLIDSTINMENQDFKDGSDLGENRDGDSLDLNSEN